MLAVGSRIGPYEVKGPLGAGGMGEVYRAHDPRLRRDVAIKILPPSVALNEDRLLRFEREARVLASLTHRHIGAIYGVEELEGNKALVLEFVDGPTLAERIGRGAMPVPEVLSVARQIADAVEAAHEQGIVHRDLKPANIKLRTDGSVVVLDFGLATATGDPAISSDASTHAALTEPGAVLGTAPYMSPEQARGEVTDKRTDIWSFGCVLFEMLTGRRAFGGKSAVEVATAILHRDPEWALLPGATPPTIQLLLRRCLQRETRQRLRDIGDARIVIEDVQSGRVPQEAAPTRRSRASWLAFLAIAVAASVVTWAVLALRGNRERPGDEFHFDRVIRLVATPAHEFGPAISPDGKWVAYLSDARGVTDVWVKFIAGGDAVNLTASAPITVQAGDLISGLEISPDGAQMAFTAGPPGSDPNQHSTWVMAAPLGGVPRRFLPAGDQGMRWSPDGARIAYVRTGGIRGDALIVADADGQNAREVVPREGARHLHWLRWSPDGALLYFNAGRQPNNTEVTEIFRVAVAGGTPERVIASARRAAFPFPVRNGLIYAANPDSVDLNLWWRDFATGRDRRITSGVGEYTMPALSADGKRLVGTVGDVQQTLHRVHMEPGGPARLEALTAGYTGDVDPVWSPDGSRLVFSSSRTGNRNIWKAQPDLSSPVPLTSGSAIDERPAFSPDGQQVAFVSTRSGRRGIWVVHLDGGAPRLIASADVLDTISWSPDGQRIVYSEPSQDAPRLMIIRVSDGQVVPLPTPGAATAPTWCPSDDVIAYLEQRRGQTTLLRLIGSDGTMRNVEQDTGHSGIGLLAWSHDGRRLAGVGFPFRRGYIWIFDPRDPTGSKRLLEIAPNIAVRGLAWSPDGRSLVIAQARPGADIMLAERSQ